MQAAVKVYSALHVPVHRVKTKSVYSLDALYIFCRIAIRAKAKHAKASSVKCAYLT